MARTAIGGVFRNARNVLGRDLTTPEENMIGLILNESIQQKSEDMANLWTAIKNDNLVRKRARLEAELKALQ